MTLLCAGGFDLRTEFFEEIVLTGSMHMTVEHPAVFIVGCFMKRHGIMAHDNVPAIVCDFLVVFDVLKEFSNLPAELLWVVVAGNQNLIACKWAEVERPLRFLCPDEITDHVHSVIAGYPAVPVIQNGIVHFGKISKGTIIKSNDICMTEMQVCNVVICDCVTVFRDMECQCPLYIINQLVQDDFFCAVMDAVHAAYPLHLGGGF